MKSKEEKIDEDRRERDSKDDDERIKDDLEDLETTKFVGGNKRIGIVPSSNYKEADESENLTWRYVPGLGFRRYKNALSNVIPFRGKYKGPMRNPVDRAGLFSFAFYTWLSKHVYRAYRKGFDVEGWPMLSPWDRCELNVDRLEMYWKDELRRVGPEKASFGKVIWRFVRTRFITVVTLMAVCCICGFFSQAITMQKLLENIQTPEAPYSEGIKWACLFILGESLRWFFLSWFSAMTYRTAIRLKSACMMLLYRKVIRMNHLGNTSIGELINIFSSDCQRIFEMTGAASGMIGAPVLAICGIWYITQLLGPMALLGMLVFSLYFPSQYIFARIARHLRANTVRVTDTRIRLTNEILECIKLIKLYAWEKRFCDNVFSIRNQELRYVFLTDCCTSTNFAMLQTLPVVATIVTFIAHLSTGRGLTSAEAFPISTFFASQMLPNLLRVRGGLQSVIDCSVAFGRLKRILIKEDDAIVISKPIVKSQAVTINQGTFACQATTDPKKKGSGDKDNKSKNVATQNGKQTEKEKIETVTKVKRIHVLFDINFVASKGKLIGICGQVGSGKSSLMLAGLGQLPAIQGQVMRDGSCAYVSQQAWIINATLRDNILFGEPFDAERYEKAVFVCNLNHDLTLWPGGDLTEIGEKGINLSGGQKQRVALARALYADRHIYFLDDPLSAVDAHVGLHIFNHLIIGALRGKTILFVTHQIQYLNRCDDVYLMRDGRIAEHGTHNELMKLNQEYAAMVNSITAESSETATLAATDEDPKVEDEPNAVVPDGIRKRTISVRKETAEKTDGKENLAKMKTTLIEAEKMVQGTVDNKTYLAYVSAAGGWWAGLLIFTLTFIYCCCFTFSSWWLAHWLNAGGGNKTDPGTNVTMVSDNITTVLDNVTMVSDNVTMVSDNITAVLDNITTVLDNVTMVSDNVTMVSDNITAVLDNITMVSDNITRVSDNINDNPHFAFYQIIYAMSMVAVVVASLIRNIIFCKLSNRAAKNLHKNMFRRIMSSPMRFFDTTPAGRIQNLFSRDFDDVDFILPTQMNFILIYLLQNIFSLVVICTVFPWILIPVAVLLVTQYFVNEVYRISLRGLKRLESTTRSPMLSHLTATVQGLNTIHAFEKDEEFKSTFSKLVETNSSFSFLSMSVSKWLGVRIDGLTILMPCSVVLLVAIFKGQVSPALAGLALSYSVFIANIFQYIVRMMSDIQTRFISVERINQYINLPDVEGDNGKPLTNVSSYWPISPVIKFDNIHMSYGKETPLVLKGVSFAVKPREKIGIVGRTGSGKSSLTVALFRLVELSEGKITIDDVDISEVGLEQLRSRLSIIPQDPILFSGTIRSNLDPFKTNSDSEIWEALEKTKLKDRVQSIAGQLDATVGFGGDNLSVGERQLLCLARALLRHTKILVLDEATAAVDPETETLVQSTIQQAFVDSTVLTIAHRLQTVVTCDRVLVMDDGKVAEFDTPANLLADETTRFAKMMEAAEEATHQ